MTLLEAPFRSQLRVLSLTGLSEEARMVLLQLGVEPGEALEKMHVAPLGDPLTIRIGEQLFTLRKEVCGLIEVES